MHPIQWFALACIVLYLGPFAIFKLLKRVFVATKTLVLTNPKGEKVKVLSDPIGYLDNRWRQRKVVIYQVVDHPELVVSVGTPYVDQPQDKIVVVQEAKTLYESTIAKFPGEEVFQ